MDYEKLKTYPISDLQALAKDMDIDVNNNETLTKSGLINKIIECFKEYEDYTKTKKERYRKIQQIGNKGKEGVTYLVYDNVNKKEYAMKTFSKRKSSKKIELESELQDIVAKTQKIAPDVIDVDSINDNFIVMEKMEEHLFDKLMNKQRGILTEKQQKDLINIFKKLDEAKVFHGDSNILNYMYKGKKLYIIDFGMSRKIDDALIKKLKTATPNYYFMTLGFILKLKELNLPDVSYKYLLTHVSDEDKEKFGL